jgi:hypothetical protein
MAATSTQEAHMSQHPYTWLTLPRHHLVSPATGLQEAAAGVTTPLPHTLQASCCLPLLERLRPQPHIVCLIDA